MDKKKSATESFLESIEANNQVSPFLENAEPTFEQQEETIEEPKEEKPLPFNKDPKVQKYLEKREKEIESRLLESLKNNQPVKEEKVEDDYYVRLIGNDTPEKVAMIKEAMARDERILQQAEERAFNRLSAKEQEALRADKEAEEELENAFENIEESYDVDFSTATGKKTRQEFATFVEKIAPKDRNGDIENYPDMNSAWETFSELKKSTATPSRAKELASRSMARSSEATVTAKPVNTRPWQATEDFLDTLTK